jgi:hypothetical protein
MAFTRAREEGRDGDAGVFRYGSIAHEFECHGRR